MADQPGGFFRSFSTGVASIGSFVTNTANTVTNTVTQPFNQSPQKSPGGGPIDIESASASKATPARASERAARLASAHAAAAGNAFEQVAAKSKEAYFVRCSPGLSPLKPIAFASPCSLCLLVHVEPVSL